MMVVVVVIGHLVRMKPTPTSSTFIIASCMLVLTRAVQKQVIVINHILSPGY